MKPYMYTYDRVEKELWAVGRACNMGRYLCNPISCSWKEYVKQFESYLEREMKFVNSN